MTVTVSRQVGYTTGVLLDSLMRDLGGGRGQVSLGGSLQVSCGDIVLCTAVTVARTIQTTIILYNQDATRQYQNEKMMVCVQVGVYCLSGPIVGKLVTTHGPRRVCVAGALTAALGLMTGSYAPSLSVLVWCYSVVTGLGFGLMYIPRWRAL